ncbi:outer membrane protein assembly factor BamB family protein [Lignipirellula cremea]|uniref:Serine/threonine-protein kinase AfsK n=1 Tax=Lignipirellula cremea TaxID=2528010 RepID=A0A518DQD1_9BACT|nr:PQQ-binding-like beta-propeller repeat protein [Lignipirellula cremea]QDU94039.1 Serine/threonine-protein kinase AfsK [Lignipirellula cremea]
MHLFRSFGVAFAGVCLAGMLSTNIALAQTPGQQAAEILAAAEIQGGLILHVGCGTGQVTAALRANDHLQVHGVDADAAKVAVARAFLQEQQFNGTVAVDRLSTKRLPYIDNLANLVVVSDPGLVSPEEVLRVLAPRGVALTASTAGWTKLVKPVPGDIDDWTHYLHDATGNAVAHDDQVGPPRHLQWLGSPRWSRHHDRMASMSALVSAAGRMFYVMDEGSRISIQLPADWQLIARDAYNGVVLWKLPIPNWQSHLWPLKSGPTNLARRLVATENRVYTTLGYEAPVSAIDAVTGDVLRTYADTGAAEEMILAKGVLYVLVNKNRLELADFAPQFNTGDQGRVAKDFAWDGKPRQIVAVEAETGRTLWTKDSVVAPLTLTCAGKHVCFHDGDKVVCLNGDSGEVQWESEPAARRSSVTFNFGPKLVLYQEVVLFAGGDRTMRAFDIATGKQLWTAPHAQSGYQSPEDLLIADGLVWNAPTTRTQDTGEFIGRDPRSGEVKKQFPPDVNTYWFHHRCYIAKATDRFLIPSRTGIEFVDFKKETWDINHWVRGGCLYGVMPCNGLMYAPPHNCACYPEAKLFGFNALAPASASRQSMAEVDEQGRFERGSAAGEPVASTTDSAHDWPTFRGANDRGGRSAQPVGKIDAPLWQAELGEARLSSPVIAGGRLYVAKIDAHQLLALDSTTGETAWTYTTGGRIDSPPTIDQGRVFFGSADGWVYCLRAADGGLLWRFRAAPQDVRLMAFEQLESVWPVHGNILVHEGAAYCVAGRSNFLDGGLRFFKFDAATGEKLVEKVIDERDPETGENLQDRLQVLQMPAGLPDILSTDGKFIYMRSQRFDFDGNREDIGPVSGNTVEQTKDQSGPGAHLFSPTGFLDDSYFHRSYWIYGKSFAGGHNGYYQAARFAPAGRMIAFDAEKVYSFGRKPEYLKWTTTLEHQLCASPKGGPGEVVEETPSGPSMIRVEKSKSLDPTNKPVVLSLWVKAEKPEGVLAARGGPAAGFALVLANGKPQFLVRTKDGLYTAAGEKSVVGRWVHLCGVLTAKKQVELYLDGVQVATTQADSLLTVDPVQSLEIGADDLGAVGNYKSPHVMTGALDQVRLYFGEATAAEIRTLFDEPATAKLASAVLALDLNFDEGNAADTSGNKNLTRATAVRVVDGKVGKAAYFTRRAGGPSGGSFVKHAWTDDVPLLARAMTLAGTTLFVAGPPDVMDEEKTFTQLTQRDPDVQAVLDEQNAAVAGKRGARLLAVSAKDGKILAEYSLESPPVWDGMAAANGRLYVVTTEGKIVCLGENP